MSPAPSSRPLNMVFLRMLWLQLFLPLLVSAFLMMALVGFLGSRSFQAQQLGLTNSVVLTVNNYLRDAMLVLETLALRNEFHQPEEIELSMEIVKRGYPYFEAFYFLDETGRVQAAIPNGELYRGMDMSRQNYFQAASATTDVVITQPFISVNTGNPAIYLARSVNGRGVIAVELNLNDLQRIVSSGPGMVGSSEVFITDINGTVLAHPRRELVQQQVYLGSLDLLKRAHDRPTSMYYFHNGRFVIGGAASIRATGWVVASQTDVREVFMPLLLPTLAFVLLTIITQVLFIRLFSRKFDQAILKPLSKLSQVTGQVASGSYAVNDQVEKIPHSFSEISALAGSFSEMTRSVLMREKKLQHLATHDALTDLPNRSYFHQKLTQCIQYNQGETSMLAVLFIDLDDFKTINDAFGHHVGDLALQWVAQQLLSVTRASDTVSRLGGDEFGILLEGVRSIQNAADIAGQVVHSMNRPIYIEGHELYISCSIGVSLYAKDGLDADTLIQNADTAMYRAKHEGKNTFQCYSLEMETLAQERHLLSTCLHHALENNEFELHYQPIYTPGTRRLFGSEALIRWNNPRLGRVPPDQFIPLANETGLILSIGEWVLRTACLQNQTWRQAGHGELRININLAERQLKHGNFVQTLARVLAESGLPPHLLNLELTENILYQNSKEIIPTLLEIKRLGVMLSLDDFGTGKGTLSVLTQIPFDELKIDRRLSQDVTIDRPKAVIVQGIIQMASGLGKTVVAEGLETPEQVAFFESMGVCLQGYYFSRPLPAPAMDELLWQKQPGISETQSS